MHRRRPWHSGGRLFFWQMKWRDSVWNKTVRCDQPPSQAELSTPSEENVVTGARDPSDAILPYVLVERGRRQGLMHEFIIK